jgi:hypothetical protein
VKNEDFFGGGRWREKGERTGWSVNMIKVLHIHVCNPLKLLKMGWKGDNNE